MTEAMMSKAAGNRRVFIGPLVKQEYLIKIAKPEPNLGGRNPLKKQRPGPVSSRTRVGAASDPGSTLVTKLDTERKNTSKSLDFEVFFTD